MRFLADESFDFRIARALTAAGHDVLTMSEHAPGADDSAVLQIATDQDRVLLTEDKDFGWLVYVSGMSARGVILVRCVERERATLIRKFPELVAAHAGELHHSFVVVTPDKARFSRLPAV